MSVHPTARSAPASGRDWLERASHSAPKPSTSPASHAAARSRRPGAVTPSREERSQRIPRQLALRNEPAGGTAGEPPPVGGNPPRRYQHHHRRIPSPRQPLSNLKT